MGRPRITIDAAVFAPSVGIYAVFEPEVGTVIPCEESFGVIDEEFCGDSADFLLFFGKGDFIFKRLQAELFEAIWRIEAGSAAFKGYSLWCHGVVDSFVTITFMKRQICRIGKYGFAAFVSRVFDNTMQSAKLMHSS